MATNFPNSLDDSTTIPVESANTKLSVNHVTAHQNIQDAIEAIEAKVGANSSAVTTSHDYKLSEVTSTDKAVGKTATQTLTNKTLTSPVVNVGSDAEGDTYYRNSSGAFTRLARGTDNHIMKMNGNVPNWEAEATISAATESAEGISRLATAAQITSGTASESGYPLVVTPDQLAASTPVFNGSGLTNLTNPAVYKTGTATRQGNTASGTQTIAHGLGKTPKFVKITAFLTNSTTSTSTASSFGAYDGTTNACILTNNPFTAAVTIATANGQAEAYIAYLAYSNSFGTGHQRATATVDSTNITLSWTYSDNGGNTGLGTNNILMLWETTA